MLARAHRARRHARRDAARRTPARFPPTSSPRLAEPHFARVETVAGPGGGARPGRGAIAGPDGAVLVTGSLYLLAALSASMARTRTISACPWASERLHLRRRPARPLRWAGVSRRLADRKILPVTCEHLHRSPQLLPLGDVDATSASAWSRSSCSSGSRRSSGCSRTRGGGSRIRSLIALATLIGAVPPFLGPLIYMLFRPPEYLEDVRERELEIRAIESRLGARETRCKVCGCEVEPDFLVCPVCTTKLRAPCVDVRAAARAGLAGLPVLRDAGAGRRRRWRCRSGRRPAGRAHPQHRHAESGKLAARWPSSAP